MGKSFKTATPQYQDFIFQPNYDVMSALADKTVQSDALDRQLQASSNLLIKDTFDEWKPNMDAAVSKYQDEITEATDLYIKDKSKEAKIKIDDITKRLKAEYNSGDIGQMASHYEKTSKYLQELKEQAKAAKTDTDKADINSRIAMYSNYIKNQVDKGFKDFAYDPMQPYLDAQGLLKENVDPDNFKYTREEIQRNQPFANINGKAVLKSALTPDEKGRYLDAEGKEIPFYQGEQAMKQILPYQYQLMTITQGGFKQKDIYEVAMAELGNNTAFANMVRQDYDNFNMGGDKTFKEYYAERITREAANYSQKFPVENVYKETASYLTDTLGMKREDYNLQLRNKIKEMNHAKDLEPKEEALLLSMATQKQILSKDELVTMNNDFKRLAAKQAVKTLSMEERTQFAALKRSRNALVVNIPIDLAKEVLTLADISTEGMSETDIKFAAHEVRINALQGKEYKDKKQKNSNIQSSTYHLTSGGFDPKPLPKNNNSKIIDIWTKYETDGITDNKHLEGRIAETSLSIDFSPTAGKVNNILANFTENLLKQVPTSFVAIDQSYYGFDGKPRPEAKLKKPMMNGKEMTLNNNNIFNIMTENMEPDKNGRYNLSQTAGYSIRFGPRDALGNQSVLVDVMPKNADEKPFTAVFEGISTDVIDMVRKSGANFSPETESQLRATQDQNYHTVGYGSQSLSSTLTKVNNTDNTRTSLPFYSSGGSQYQIIEDYTEGVSSLYFTGIVGQPVLVETLPLTIGPTIIRNAFADKMNENDRTGQ